MNLLAAACLALLAPSALHAAGSDPYSFFHEELQVVTSARRAQPARGSPVAVDVITAEDIAHSPAADVWDLLRFRAGVDVIDGRSTGGANRAVVSVRGFNRDLVTELQVLVDGRSVYSPVSGGVLWDQVPVQLQDIERIEIVRGPNAALYGSNAGLGVINIITRRPRRPASVSARLTAATLATRVAETALEGSGARWGGRVSHTWRNNDGYPKDDGTGQGNDFVQANKANARGWWRPDEGTLVEGLAGGSWDTAGKPVANDPRGLYQTWFGTARLDKELSEDSRLELSASRNDQTARERDRAPGADRQTRYYQYDLEAMHLLGWLDGRLHTTWGGSWRYAAVESQRLFRDGDPRLNRTWRLFAHQTARVLEPLTLVVGASLEDPEHGTRHADYQASAVYAPLPEHALRAGYSVAHTNPYPANTVVDLDIFAPFIRLAGNPRLRSYELSNTEAGYRGEYAGGRLVLDADFFYTKIRDHVNIEIDRLPFSYENTNFIIARGLETQLRWRDAGWTAYANHTTEVVTDRDGHRLYVDTTPKHKLNLGGWLDLGRGWSASVDAGWKDGYLADSNSGAAQRDIAPFWRLDARLAWKPVADVELFLSGRNLLKPKQVEFVDGLTVPRVLGVGVSARWQP